MSDKLKTIHDIIAEKRSIAKCIRDDASNGDYWDKKKANEEAEEYEWDADSIEAAYKREMGNAQKMRDMLVKAHTMLKVCDWSEDVDRDGVALLMHEIESALSAPPHNCDRFGGDIARLREEEGGE